MANYVAVDGSPRPSMAAMDGLLCRKWSPGSKPEKQWLQTLTDEVTIKKLITPTMFVAIANLVSLPRPLFYTFANRK